MKLIYLLIFLFGINAIAVPKIQKISEVPIKNFFLSYEDLATLSESERTTYLLSLSSILTVMELSQDEHLGKYDSTFKTSQNEKKSEYFASFYKKLDLYLAASINDSNAFVAAGVRLAWLGLSKAAPLFENAFLSVSKYAARFTGFTAQKAAATTAARAGTSTAQAAEGLVVREFTKAELKAAEKVAAKFGIEAAQVPHVLELRSLSNGIKAAAKSGNHAEAAKLMESFKGLLSKIEKDPATLAKLDKFFQQAGMKAHLITAGKFAAPTAVAEALFNWDKLTEMFNEAPQELKDLGNTLIQEGGPTVAAGLRTVADKIDPTNGKPMLAGGYVPVQENGCIYGLWQSVWVVKGSKGYCTRPKESSVKGCEGSMFLCPNMGVSADGVANTTLFCIPSEPKADISVRCNKNFKEKLEKKELKLTQEAYDKMIKSLKFKGSQGDLTLAKYCEGASTIQGSECGALMEIEKIYKETKIGDLVMVAANAAIGTPPAAGAPQIAPTTGTDGNKIGH